jgi:uncharacterized protein YjbI with pentapeptide repeats
MTELTAVAPKSVWQRSIKVDFRKMFMAVGKVAVDLATLSWDSVAKDGLGAVDALGLAETPGQAAGRLLGRALTRAVVELIEPYRRDLPEQLRDFGPEIEAFLTEREYELDERFLEHPRDLPIVADFQHAFEHWLKFVDMRGHVASTIAARLPARFVYALHRECIERRADHVRLFEALEGKFTSAWQRERSWEEYRHYVESTLAEPVFGEDFGLAQIFQWPRAYHEERPHAGRRERHEQEHKLRHVVGLCEALDRWLGERDSLDAVRVLSGDPGAGKTSFTRMYAAHRLASGDRVLLIPLHMLNVGHDLYESIKSLCAATAPYPGEPFDGDVPLLLILDGLDELSRQGSSGAQLARDFYQHVQQLVTTRNQGGLRLRVIVSGRPIAVQELETDARKTGQLLYLLPYAIGETSRQGWKWADPDRRLAVDQRHAWWMRYGELTGSGEIGLPEALAGESLFETTIQPLLGYLLALVYRDAVSRGQTIERDVSRNEIYARLLKSVYERDYDKPAGGHKAVRGLEREEFEELLEEMALVAWHADTRVVRAKAVEAACKRSGLDGVLDRYVKHSHAGVAQLFTAFYFRRSGGRAGDDEAFEFTHKSFAEYLVARRFVAQLAIAARDLAARGTSRGRLTQGKDMSAVLLDWLTVFGPSPITRELVGYLETEIRLRSDGEQTARAWQGVCKAMIEEVLREDMPCERVTGLRFGEMLRWSANAEFALLVLLQGCSSVTQEITVIDWGGPKACKDWLARLRALNTMTPLTLSWISLWGLNLWGADLEEAYLVHADLLNTWLARAYLESANLMNANLQRATLIDAYLLNANLQNANLQNANLESAYLLNANLKNANLESANLESANLENANLESANLESANLKNANLAGADLRGCSVTPEQLATSRGAPRFGPKA